MRDRVLITSMLRDIIGMLGGELQENENAYIRAALNYAGCALNQLEVYKRMEDAKCSVEQIYIT